MTDTHWSLKILSGAHSGAEIDLEAGSYSLGRHEDCDFVLTDETLQEQQLEITITDQGIQLQSLNNQTFVINGENAGTSCNAEQHQLISLAGLSFAFGKPGIPWPSLALSTTSHTPIVNKNEANEVSEETANADSAVVTQEQPREKPQNGEKAVLPESSGAGKKRWRLPGLSFRLADLRLWIKQSAYRYRWIIAGVSTTSLLVILIFGFLWFWQQTAPENSLKKQVNYMKVAEKIRTRLMLPDIHLRQMADGTILVSGYIVDNDKRDTLVQQLEAQSVPLKIQLIVMSDMRAAAVQVLKKAGYKHMHIELDTTPGSLVLSGYAPSVKYVNKIRELLNTEVPGLLSIVEQLEYQSTREKTLRTMLQEAGLNTQIKLLEQPGKVIMKGRLGDISQGYRFKEIVTNFREKYGNRPELSIDVSIPSTNMNTLRPELNIKSISLGRTPYVILEDGEKYLPGAKLENGYILESIGLDYLILSLGQKQIKYNVRNNHD